MFDFPQPLGPTMTLTPGENSSRVRSGNDLNPLIVIEAQMHAFGRLSVWSDVISAAWLWFRRESAASYGFRRSSASAAAACSAAFLLRPSPVPITSESSWAATSNRRACGGPASRITS